MNRAAVVVMLATLRGLGAQSLPAPDSVRLIANITALSADSMEGRRIGSRGAARARVLIARELALMGIMTSSDSFTVRGTGATGVNVVAAIRGRRHPERFIVVSAHYDHLGMRAGSVYPGADDNASGTAAVVAMAEWFKTHAPENSLLFAFFDGEEAGLLGAKAFVAKPPVPVKSIIADVNLDMVSRNDKGELYASGASAFPVMRPLLDSVAKVAAVRLQLGHDTGIGEANWIQQSDQGAFAAKKIPFVYFGVEDHADYHKPTDTVAHIDAGFFYRSVRTITEFVRRLDIGLDRVAAIR